LHYVLSNTLQARGEFTRVNEEDMMVIAKAVIPNCNLTLNLGAIILFHLEYKSHQTRGPICCGGVITDGCEKQPSLSMFKSDISQVIDEIYLSTCQ
jgi:hypothetical protein